MMMTSNNLGTFNNFTILNLQTIFDMETFVIGGGISAQPILIEEVNRQFDKVHHEIDFIGKIINT